MKGVGEVQDDADCEADDQVFEDVAPERRQTTGDFAFLVSRFRAPYSRSHHGHESSQMAQT